MVKQGRRAPGNGKLYAMLIRDHRLVQGMFKRVLKEPSEELFSRIKNELQMHMEGEEQFFYPELERYESVKEDVLEGFEEHHIAKTVIGELDDLSQGDERWTAKMKVLSDIVNHHIEEEETNMFKKSAKELEKEKSEEIAESIAEEKERFRSEGAIGV